MTVAAPANPLELGQPIVEIGAPEESDDRLWSVTTIIGILEKPALIHWAAEQTALDAVHKVATWQTMERENGTAEAVDWLKRARWRTPQGERSPADLGTAVHDICEQYALTGKRPEVDAECAPYLEQFEQWLDRFQPQYIATEVTVFAPRYGFAGTCDGFFVLDGLRCIFDYKTSKKAFTKKGKPTGPYPEVALQLAAYRHAELAAVWRPRQFESFRRRYYALSDAERAMAVPVPECEAGVVVHITPEHCEAYPIVCDQPVFESFLFTLEAARFVLQDAKTVIGQPLVPKERAA